MISPTVLLTKYISDKITNALSFVSIMHLQNRNSYSHIKTEQSGMININNQDACLEERLLLLSDVSEIKETFTLL